MVVGLVKYFLTLIFVKLGQYLFLLVLLYGGQISVIQENIVVALVYFISLTSVVDASVGPYLSKIARTNKRDENLVFYVLLPSLGCILFLLYLKYLRISELGPKEYLAPCIIVSLILLHRLRYAHNLGSVSVNTANLRYGAFYITNILLLIIVQNHYVSEYFFELFLILNLFMLVLSFYSIELKFQVRSLLMFLTWGKFLIFTSLAAIVFSSVDRIFIFPKFERDALLAVDTIMWLQILVLLPTLVYPILVKTIFDGQYKIRHCFIFTISILLVGSILYLLISTLMYLGTVDELYQLDKYFKIYISFALCYPFFLYCLANGIFYHQFILNVSGILCFIFGESYFVSAPEKIEFWSQLTMAFAGLYIIMSLLLKKLEDDRNQHAE